MDAAVKIAPKNWRDFQHYKDRNPPWIRLHRGLLDNFEFQCLPVASRALAPMLWLLASDSVDGEIDATAERLAFRLRMSVDEVRDALKPLIDKGFFIVKADAAIKPLARRKRIAVPETEAEALQKQPLPAKPAVEGFEAFYAAYPRKVKPKDARKAWDKLKPDVDLQARILSAIGQQRKSPQWQKDGGQFIPYPATWLNAGEWDNQAPELAAPDGSGLTALTAAFNADMDQRAAEATRPPVDLMRRLGRAA
jgi:hypothetical protein